MGIEVFLGNDKGPLSFRGMLQSYRREDLTQPDTTQRHSKRLWRHLVGSLQAPV